LPHQFGKLKAKYFFSGYPLQILDQICSSKWASPRANYNKTPFTAFLPYLGEISDQIASLCSTYQVRVIPSPTPALKQLLLPSSDVRSRPSKKEYVYALPCASCPKMYIGQTSRAELRLHEHLRDVKAKKTSSAPYMHFKTTGHLPAENGFPPLVYSPFYFNRLNMETTVIMLLKDQLINLQIPTNFSIQKWLKYLDQNYPAIKPKICETLRKQIADKLKPKPARQFQFPTIPKKR
jgi:hypothetical protein